MSDTLIITPSASTGLSETAELIIRASESYLAGRITHTRQMYAGRIRLFLEWTMEQPYQEIVPLLKTYMGYLRDIRKLAARTIQGHIGVLKGVIRAAAELYEDNLSLGKALRFLNTVKPPKQLGQIQGVRLSAEQLQKLIDAPGAETFKGLRDTCILGLLGVLGLRRSEVCNLTWGHIQQIEGHWTIANLSSKHGRIRTIKLTPDLYEMIRQWGEVSGRDMTASDVHIFCPVNRATKKHPLGVVLSKREGIKAHTIYGMLHQRCDQAGIPRIEPHDLRRTAARLARDGGASIEQVQDMLGHADPQTTSAYIGEGLNLNDNAVDYNPIRMKGR